MVVYWDCLISCSVILAKKYENPFFVNNLDWGPVLRFASWKHCSQCGLLYDSPFSKHSYFGCQVPLASTTRGSPLAAREGTMDEKWWPNGAWHMHPGFFYMPQICDMGQIILLPFRRKACRGFLSPFKNPTDSAGFEPANLGIRGQNIMKEAKIKFPVKHTAWSFRNVSFNASSILLLIAVIDLSLSITIHNALFSLHSNSSISVTVQN